MRQYSNFSNVGRPQANFELGMYPGSFDDYLSAGQHIKDLSSEYLNPALQAAGQYASQLPGQLQNLGQGAYDAGVNLGQNLPGLPGQLRDAGINAMNGVYDTGVGVGQGAVNAAKGIYSRGIGAGQGIAGVGRGIYDAGMNAGQGLVDAGRGLYESGQQVGETIGTRIGNLRNGGLPDSTPGAVVASGLNSTDAGGFSRTMNPLEYTSVMGPVDTRMTPGSPGDIVDAGATNPGFLQNARARAGAMASGVGSGLKNAGNAAVGYAQALMDPNAAYGDRAIGAAEAGLGATGATAAGVGGIKAARRALQSSTPGDIIDAVDTVDEVIEPAATAAPNNRLRNLGIGAGATAAGVGGGLGYNEYRNRQQ